MLNWIASIIQESSKSVHFSFLNFYIVVFQPDINFEKWH